jgi:hypothetical protein
MSENFHIFQHQLRVDFDVDSSPSNERDRHGHSRRRSSRLDDKSLSPALRSNSRTERYSVRRRRPSQTESESELKRNIQRATRYSFSSGDRSSHSDRHHESTCSSRSSLSKGSSSSSKSTHSSNNGSHRENSGVSDRSYVSRSSTTSTQSSNRANRRRDDEDSGDDKKSGNGRKSDRDSQTGKRDSSKSLKSTSRARRHSSRRRESSSDSSDPSSTRRCHRSPHRRRSSSSSGRRTTDMPKPEKFNGSMCLQTFIAQFENCARHNKWNSETKAAHLINSVTGSAGVALWDEAIHPRTSTVSWSRV